MLTSVPHGKLSSLSALSNLLGVDLAGRLARWRERAARRGAEELLDRMSPELLDDLGSSKTRTAA